MPDASFDLDGGPGGKIKNTLTQDEPKKQKYVPRAELSFQTGSGGRQRKMNTISGGFFKSSNQSDFIAPIKMPPRVKLGRHFCRFL